MSLPLNQNTQARRSSLNLSRQRPSEYSPFSSSLPVASPTISFGSNSSDQHIAQPPIASNVSHAASSPANTLKNSRSNASSSNNLNVKKRYHQFLNNWITDWWGIELISWAISASSVLAIFILLESHRGRPLPQWPFSITVNSLVSVFATISQMAMMTPVVECISQLKWLWFRKSRKLLDFQHFDDASRGPTGSLSLLGKLRSLHLVSLGALITVLTVAFGPVSQQVVAYPLHLHPVANSSAPQALFLTTLVNGFIYPVLDAAINTALTGTRESLSSVIPSCNTGNCTWDIYPSLAICVNTVDVSHTLINNTCNTTALSDKFNLLGTSNPGYPCFNYSLPFYSNNLVSSGSATNTQGGTLIPSFSNAKTVLENATLSDVVEDLYAAHTDLSFLTLSTGFYSDYSITDINLLYQPGIEKSINSTLPPPVALQSSLQLCVQSYNTTVSDGKTSTQVVSQELLNVTSLLESQENSTFTVNDTTFGISPTELRFFKDLAASYFTDWCTFVLGLQNTTDFEENTAGNTACYSTVGEGFLTTMLNATDTLSAVDSLVKNVAISVTNSFRQGAGGSIKQNQFQGKAYLPTTYVETNYVWFTLPIGLVLLTLIFLVATINRSQRLGIKTWKSSNFSTLRSLHPDVQDQLGGLEALSVMEEKAGEIVVRLNPKADGKNGVGWRLMRAS